MVIRQRKPQPKQRQRTTTPPSKKQHIGFLPGNQLWRYAQNQGKPRYYPTPESLWEAATRYFEWVEQNPLKEERVVSDRGTPDIIQVSKMQAMTLGGLCIFLNISMECWTGYRHRPEYGGVIGIIEGIIKNQKFTGAAAGLLNANIIARDLGLAERTDVTSSDGSMTPRISEGMTPTEAALLYKQIIKGGK